MRPFGFILKSGDRFVWNLLQSYDRLDYPFALTDSAVIPIGKYHMHNSEFVFTSYQARKIWFQLGYNYGTFYTGAIRTLATSFGINFSRHFNITTDYTHYLVRLPYTQVISNQLDQYLNYAFTTKLDLSLFAQWNSLEDIMLYNFRLHWIPKIGTDIYVVYNRGYDHLKLLDWVHPQSSEGVGKLVWRFTF